MQPQPGLKPGVDPYFAWAVASAFADYGTTSATTLFTVLAECQNPAGVQALNLSMKAWAGNGNGALAGVTPAYLAAPVGARSGTFLPTRFCVLQVQRQLIDQLPTLTDLVRWEIGAPVRVQPTAKAVPDQADDAPALQGVVAGVIDDFVAFRHDEFRDANGSSRIAWLWDQNHIAARAPRRACAATGRPRVPDHAARLAAAGGCSRAHSGCVRPSLSDRRISARASGRC